MEATEFIYVENGILYLVDAVKYAHEHNLTSVTKGDEPVRLKDALAMEARLNMGDLRDLRGSVLYTLGRSCEVSHPLSPNTLVYHYNEEWRLFASDVVADSIWHLRERKRVEILRDMKSVELYLRNKDKNKDKKKPMSTYHGD